MNLDEKIDRKSEILCLQSKQKAYTSARYHFDVVPKTRATLS